MGLLHAREIRSLCEVQRMKVKVQNQTGRKIKYLHSDNGRKYRDERFMEFFKQQGITCHFTVKRTPQQNGAAERMNRTLMERERGDETSYGVARIFLG